MVDINNRLLNLKDTIIFSKDIEKRLHHVDECRTTIGEAVFTVNRKNFRFLSVLVVYLGRIIEPGQLHIDQSYKKCLRSAKNEKSTHHPDVFTVYETSSVYSLSTTQVLHTH